LFPPTLSINHLPELCIALILQGIYKFVLLLILFVFGLILSHFLSPHFFSSSLKYKGNWLPAFYLGSLNVVPLDSLVTVKQLGKKKQYARRYCYVLQLFREFIFFLKIKKRHKKKSLRSRVNITVVTSQICFDLIFLLGRRMRTKS
jgi:hypothetical protein